MTEGLNLEPTKFSSVPSVIVTSRLNLVMQRSLVVTFIVTAYWQRVQHDWPVFILLMESLVLSDAQLEDYRNRPCKRKAEGFSFSEDLLPACTQMESSVPLLTKFTNC